jgi:hypothetical protein
MVLPANAPGRSALGQLRGRAGPAAPGDGDHQVADRPGLSEEPPQRVRLLGIYGHRLGPVAELFDGGVQPVAIAPADRDPGTPSGQQPGRFQPDAGAAAEHCHVTAVYSPVVHLQNPPFPNASFGNTIHERFVR